MTVLRELLLDSRDGEWGKGEHFAGGHWSSVIRGTDFAGSRIGEVSKVPNRVLEDRHLRRKVLVPNDIIIETAGGTKDQPTGRTLYVTERLLRALPHPAVCASFARFLRIDPTKADPGYVFWLLQDHYLRRELLRFHTQHTGVARFQFTTFADTYEFQLPTPEVQRSVASILFAYDDLVEVNQRRTAILEDIARRLFDEWFVRFRYPGHEAVPLVETELGWVPEGWSVSPLGALVSDSIGGTWGEEEPAFEAPVSATVIRGTDFIRLKSGVFRSVPQRYISVQHSRTRRLEPGDVLIEVSGGSKDQPVGRTLLLDEGLFALYDNVVTFASFCRRLRPASADAAAYLDLQLEQVYLSREIMMFQKQSTGLSNLSVPMLLEKKIALPPSPILKDFAALIGPINALKWNLRNQMFRLKGARDLLLPKLISGQIDVTVAEETFAQAAE